VRIFLERFILPLSSGSILVLMFANPMHWGWPARAIGTAVALLVAIIAAFLIQCDAKAEKAIHTPLIQDAHKDRIYIPPEVTLESLQQRFGLLTQTHLQTERSIEPYIGKWVRYRGKIDDVVGTGVFFEPFVAGSNLGKVVAYFDGRWLDYLQLLPRGKIVTIEGQLDKVSQLAVKLEKCDFVEDKDSA
jgi:hypothetical protein